MSKVTLSYNKFEDRDRLMYPTHVDPHKCITIGFESSLIGQGKIILTLIGAYKLGQFYFKVDSHIWCAR